VWADDDSEEQQAAPAQKPLHDIPLGPFRVDLSGDLRLRDEYQEGFDVRGYRSGVTDNFLLSRIMLNLDLRFDPDRHISSFGTLTPLAADYGVTISKEATRSTM